MFHLLWGFLFVWNFCRSGIFVGVFWGFCGAGIFGGFWGFLGFLGFLAVGGFWGFWRLGVFGVESVLERRCCAIDVGTSTILALLVVRFGIGFGLGIP